MKQQLTRGAALAASIIATLSATPTPVIGHNRDILILAAVTAAVLWIDLRMDTRAERIQNNVSETRAEVRDYKQHTDIGKLLRDAGQPLDDEPLALPTPHGEIRSIAADIDGEHVLVGVDQSAHLADVIELRRVLTDDSQAAQ